ncbi:hypothetical protein FHY05_003531 [Sphingomonas sp. BK580]|nr:hypothetical protein [Sphingomonas sp. BK580]
MFSTPVEDYTHDLFGDDNLQAQLIAIKVFVAHSRRIEDAEAKEIKEISDRVRSSEDESLIDVHIEALEASVYSGAAHSAALVGILAPFVENLFTGIFRGIGEKEDDYLGREPKCKRSIYSRQSFWDPHFTYTKEGVKAGFVEGVMQLAEATRLKERMPSDSRLVLESLFEYRNAMLHNGFEWPSQRRAAFSKVAAKANADWFVCSSINNEPWIWYMSDIFISRIMAFIDEVVVAVGEHVKSTYHPT